MGVGDIRVSSDYYYEDAWSKVISIMTGLVGVKSAENKCYVTLEWPPMRLTLQPKVKQLPQGHLLQCLVVNLYGASRHTHQLLPMSRPHGRVTEVINEGQIVLQRQQTDGHGTRL